MTVLVPGGLTENRPTTRSRADVGVRGALSADPSAPEPCDGARLVADSAFTAVRGGAGLRFDSGDWEGHEDALNALR